MVRDTERAEHRRRLTVATAVACALLSVGVGATSCSRKRAGAERIAPAGAEDWVVDGFPYHIAGSHYERGAGNDVVYVITYPAPPGTSAANLDRDGAAVLVWPLIKYAYNNRTFERTRVPATGSAPAPAMKLAVDIVAHASGKLLFRYENPPLQDHAAPPR